MSRPRPPAAVRRRRGRPGAALCPDHASSCGSCAGCWTEDDITFEGEHYRAEGATARAQAGRARGAAAPAALLRRRLRGGPAHRGRRGGRPALLGRAARRRGGAHRPPQDAERRARPRPAAARVRPADHHARPRHDRGGLGRRRGEGRRDGRGPARVGRRPRPAVAVGQQRLLDLAEKGDVLDDCLYTAPGTRRWRRRRHHLAGRLAGRRGQGRCAATPTSASPTSCSATRRTSRRSCASATRCCRSCADPAHAPTPVSAGERELLSPHKSVKSITYITFEVRCSEKENH